MYPTEWPHKGTLVVSESSETMLQAFLQALGECIRFWENQNISGVGMRNTLNYSKTLYGRISRATKAPGFKQSQTKYVLVRDLSENLDRLAPEGCYFGAKYGTTDRWGFWDSQELYSPYKNFH